VCRANQNSVQLLYARVGKADLVAPTLAITSPADGATVEPGFSVEATASDDVGVTMTTFSIDGQPAGMDATAGPYTFPTDPALAEGPHTLRVEATDGHNTQAQSITVIVAVTPTGSDSGSATGSDSGGDTGAGDGTVHGGCSTTGGSGGALLVGLALCLRRRRRALARQVAIARSGSSTATRRARRSRSRRSRSVPTYGSRVPMR
jgi:hypothetical protein